MHVKSFGFSGLRKLKLNGGHNITSNFGLASHKQFSSSMINIIVGPNGGGKSTVVDLIRAASDAGILPTLARENLRNDTSSGFSIRFHNGREIKAAFNAMDMEIFGLTLSVSTLSGSDFFSDEIKKHLTEEIPEKLKQVVNLLSAKVNYRNTHDIDKEISAKEITATINADGVHFLGLASNSLQKDQYIYDMGPDFERPKHIIDNPIFHETGADYLSIAFNDDVSQHNNVPIKMLPSGWRAYVGLVAWLSVQAENSICVIEEPETHIHPKLLRVMIKKVSEISDKRNLQLFITTHSSTLIDIGSWPEGKVSLFEANGFEFKELTEPSLALSNLGIRPSDVCQSNGVIWIEGASDRIYLKHWLELWCKKHKKNLPQENIAYSFVFYGGASLKHFTESDADNELIAMLKINQNSMVVMDRDFDFTSENDELVSENTSTTKDRILQEFGDNCWITQGYTIENYLHDDYRQAHFCDTDGRLKCKGKKVNVANKFKQDFNGFDSSYATNSNLVALIEKIHNIIIEWND